MKIQKKNFWRGGGGRGQGGCERRIEFSYENSKKKLGGRRAVVGGSGWGGVGLGGVRVDVNEELIFL